jgi:hypothetical protein
MQQPFPNGRSARWRLWSLAKVKASGFMPYSGAGQLVWYCIVYYVVLSQIAFL